MAKDTNTPTIETTPNLLDASCYKGAKSSLEYAIAPQKVFRRVMLTTVCDLLKEGFVRFPNLSDSNRVKLVDGIINSYVREFTNGGSAYGPESKALLVTTLKTVFTPQELEVLSKGAKFAETLKSVESIDTSVSDTSEWEE